VTPKVEQDLIAVGKDHQYKLLGHTDLAGCTKLGLSFLCEGRSVLKTDIEDSCLGALYLHNLPGVLKQFQLGETKETVFQTGPTQWLVSVPEQFASIIQFERSHETIIINPISTITVKPGCKFQLKSHLIQPDTNQQSQFQIIHHAWNWDIQLLFPTANLSLIANKLLKLRKEGAKFVTAQNLKFSEKEIEQWFSPNYIAIGCITIAILFFAYLAYRAYKYFNKRTSMFSKPPFESAINQLNRKEQMEAIKLKEQIKMIEKEENIKHPNIIKIGDLVSKKVNMSDYTVVSPTRRSTYSLSPFSCQNQCFTKQEPIIRLHFSCCMLLYS